MGIGRERGGEGKGLLRRTHRATATEHGEMEIKDNDPEQGAKGGEQAEPRLLGLTTGLLHLLVVGGCRRPLLFHGVLTKQHLADMQGQSPKLGTRMDPHVPIFKPPRKIKAWM